MSAWLVFAAGALVGILLASLMTWWVARIPALKVTLEVVPSLEAPGFTLVGPRFTKRDVRWLREAVEEGQEPGAASYEWLAHGRSLLARVAKVAEDGHA